MATVGNFGKLITFEVSSNKMLALSDFKRTVAGRWKKHEIIGAAPRPEFQGPDQMKQPSQQFICRAWRKPRATIERLESAVRSGEVDYLIIGGKRVGSGKVYISVSARNGIRSGAGRTRKSNDQYHVCRVCVRRKQ